MKILTVNLKNNNNHLLPKSLKGIEDGEQFSFMVERTKQ